MFLCECYCWDRVPDEFFPMEPQPFTLPSPIPPWPQGQGFATGRIDLGDIEVLKITEFKSIWSYRPSHGKEKGATFYKPVGIPDGFFNLGHYCQFNDKPLRGYVLVARDMAATRQEDEFCSDSSMSALRKPLSYTLIWSSESHHEGHIYIWQPKAPVGYKAMGFVVTNEQDEPELEEVRCIRADLTESCEACDLILNTDSTLSNYPIKVWNTRSSERGILGTGVPIGTFFCCTYLDSEDLEISCLKNLDSTLQAMPNLDQIHALIKHYGPTVFFHPDEVYLPSSVPWFFKNGALLYRNGKVKGEAIDSRGSNLPSGGKNDGDYWIDLPDDKETRKYLKSGNIESSVLYVHIKSALGGTFTDIAMWIFCPFNGPSTIKAGLVNIEMSKVGEHVSDWEHFTLRLSNFTGELWSIYFSEHSGGEWVDAYELEFIEGNKPIIYSAKSGHASFPHPGSYIQGSSKLGIGLRNDTARSKYYIDSCTNYEIIAAEYLGRGVVTEPHWLQYMREWVLDSSLVAAVASRYLIDSEAACQWGSQLHTFCIGLKGSPDLKAAREVAEYLHTRHHEFHFTVQEGIDALEEVIYHIETYDVTTIRASTPMFLMSRKIKSLGVKMVISGEGSDEIFGGYLYFHKAPNKEEFHQETCRKIKALHLYDCLRANKSTSAWGVEARVPFLDKEFINVAMSIDPDWKMIRPDLKRIEKWVLRNAFDDDENPYLPKHILYRQKEQFSDGVGYSWIDGLKDHANQQVTDAMLMNASFIYPENTPTTKEAYYYRTIFERFFPKNAARSTVPGGPSVACSTAKALEWDAAWSKNPDPSGRAALGVHEAAYEDIPEPNKSATNGSI